MPKAVQHRDRGKALKASAGWALVREHVWDQAAQWHDVDIKGARLHAAPRAALTWDDALKAVRAHGLEHRTDHQGAGALVGATAI